MENFQLVKSQFTLSQTQVVSQQLCWPEYNTHKNEYKEIEFP